jgi:hypothetical protein
VTKLQQFFKTLKEKSRSYRIKTLNFTLVLGGTCLKGRVQNRTEVAGSRLTQFRFTTVATVATVARDSVCDLQFKAKAFFDTAIVSSYMKPI